MAVRMECKTPTVSQEASRTAPRGLIERDLPDNDGRVVEVSLRSRGVLAVGRFWEPARPARMHPRSVAHERVRPLIDGREGWAGHIAGGAGWVALCLSACSLNRTDYCRPTTLRRLGTSSSRQRG